MVPEDCMCTLRNSYNRHIHLEKSKDIQRHSKQPKKFSLSSKTLKDIQEIQRHPKTSKATPKKPRVPKMLGEIFNYLGCSVSKGAFPDV